ncbi:hypothetical protein BT63DRAFT_423468 [Microthyrium microscopicum]|uniref:Uncharacterized protein n=1 Tax=Microthyrium microscopicum TaxID=703497 RepID=A0A6A6UGE4_9PEZI|nr:hypothetical protein BT63DRAFT_423468 [Microthyrium microscopicum]
MARKTADRHQHKRAYQPQITSFFSGTTSTNATNAGQERAPTLTPAVQSSLLSVGMRIRKAVPEGYKTHKTSLFKDPSPLAPIASYQASSRSNVTPPRPQGLQPFCGLHKVGGLGIQNSQLDDMDSYGMSYGGANDNNLWWPGSQDSNASVAGDHGILIRYIPQNKRRMDDQDHSDGEDVDEEIRFNPTFPGVESQYPGRQFAIPRSRRKEQESFSISRDSVDIDFEDAPFLKPFGEVSMGGM